ncbi:MAG: M28 family peptidase [Saprospiraceae bacterium]
MNTSLSTISILLLLFTLSCKRDVSVTKEPDQVDNTPIKVPLFVRDSAYAHVARQVAFGPRVPGTEGHKATKNWLVQKLKGYGASVQEQSFKATTETIGEVRGTNVIASFNPTYARRVLLAAHWDTRYNADEDPANPKTAHDGADDGGSGVGVLLEIARLIKENPINVGVDIVLFDVEDQGTSEGSPNTWCIGAQYWAQNPHVQSYRAEYGILLDMVGAKGAVFQKEDLTRVFAQPEKIARIHALYDKVWALAQGMKQSALFVNTRGRSFIDDHYFVNLYTEIPMIDIIHKPLNSAKGFGEHWHTHDDNMEIIDPSVLGAVGQVVTAYLYNNSKPVL